MTAWRATIDLSFMTEYDDDADFVKYRDMAVAAIKASPLYEEHLDELESLVTELSYSDDEAEFNTYWDDLYDWADDNLVWIKTVV